MEQGLTAIIDSMILGNVRRQGAGVVPALFAMVLWVSQPQPAEAATKRPKTPVMVGQEEGLDACGSSWMVTGLSSGPSGFVSVRTSPSAKAVELDRLRNRFTVFGCEEKSGFLGIVYDPKGKLDCGVGSPVAKLMAYSGPCRSGWVSKRFVTLMAG